MNFLDTSIVIRYLLNDQPELAERATKLIESGQEYRITDVVIIETGYALTKLHGIAKPHVVETLVKFVQRRNISVHGIDKETAIQALRLCEPSNRVSFGDAMIWAAARSVGDSHIYTFDKRFPTDGIKVVK